jgi:hypothetical protein
MADTGWSGLLQTAGLIMGLFLLNAPGLPGNALFFLILLVMMARSSEWTVKAMSLLFLVQVGSAALVSTGNFLFSAGKFGMLLLICLRLAYSLELQGRSVLRHPIMASLLMFVLVSLLLAIEGGYYTAISALKLLTFSIGILSVFLAVEVMKRREHSLDQWFLAMTLVVAVLGILTWVLGIGYVQRGWSRLFYGPFFHSQTLGPACAMMVLYLTMYGVLTRHKYRTLALLLVPILLFMVYLSAARTALLALAMAVLVVGLVAVFLRRSGRRKALRYLSIGGAISGAAALMILLAELAQPGIVLDGVGDFLTKGRADVVTADSITSSRQGQIDRMVGNILENPWTGIGFGTCTRLHFIENATLISAPTEKGILALAVVEETGIIGTVFFVVFLGTVFSHLIRQQNVTGLVGLAALLGINFAEMTFFSFGGSGGIYWTWAMACMILNTAAQEPRQGAPTDVTVSSGRAGTRDRAVARTARS